MVPYKRALMGGTRGTVISEPSIIATDTKQEKVVAVGDEAARPCIAHARYVASFDAFKDGFMCRLSCYAHTMLNYF